MGEEAECGRAAGGEADALRQLTARIRREAEDAADAAARLDDLMQQHNRWDLMQQHNRLDGEVGAGSDTSRLYAFVSFINNHCH